MWATAEQMRGVRTGVWLGGAGRSPGKERTAVKGLGKLGTGNVAAEEVQGHRPRQWLEL